MQPEHEYEESYEPTRPGLFANMALPFTIAMLAFGVFLYAQITNLGQNARSMEWQAANLARQIEALGQNEQSLAALVQQREALVQQSNQIQSRYNDLLTDIIELSKTDSDARAVVQKYGIQQQGNP